MIIQVAVVAPVNSPETFQPAVLSPVNVGVQEVVTGLEPPVPCVVAGVPTIETFFKLTGSVSLKVNLQLSHPMLHLMAYYW